MAASISRSPSIPMSATRRATSWVRAYGRPPRSVWTRANFWPRCAITSARARTRVWMPSLGTKRLRVEVLVGVADDLQEPLGVRDARAGGVREHRGPDRRGDVGGRGTGAKRTGRGGARPHQGAAADAGGRPEPDRPAGAAGAERPGRYPPGHDSDPQHAAPLAKHRAAAARQAQPDGPAPRSPEANPPLAGEAREPAPARSAKARNHPHPARGRVGDPHPHRLPADDGRPSPGQHANAGLRALRHRSIRDGGRGRGRAAATLRRRRPATTRSR